MLIQMQSGSDIKPPLSEGKDLYPINGAATARNFFAAALGDGILVSPANTTRQASKGLLGQIYRLGESTFKIGEEKEEERKEENGGRRKILKAGRKWRGGCFRSAVAQQPQLFRSTPSIASSDFDSQSGTPGPLDTVFLSVALSFRKAHCTSLS